MNRFAYTSAASHGVIFSALLGGCANDEVEQRRRESAECMQGAGAVYEQRIRPLLETDRPKTCNQCHLSGVDLGLFVRPTMCETRACLMERQLVDTKNISQSPILGWIQRASPESELITDEVIAEEYSGFEAFLTTLFACDSTACEGVLCSTGGGAQACGRTPEPLRPALVTQTDCDPISIEQAFMDTVYVWRDRCFPCHHTDQPTSYKTAPHWVEVRGGCAGGSATTLKNVLNGGYINVEDPTRSWLVLKPLGPPWGVEHEGGDKFEGATRDIAYLSFMSFIEYYAACASSDSLE